MTPTPVPGTDVPTSDGAERTGRSLPLLLAAAGLVVAVVVAVLLFGVARPPALDPLADHPGDAPDVALAWLGWDGGGNCLGVAWPDATETRPFCDDEASDLRGWVDDETVLIANWEPDARALEVDARDGTVRGTRPRAEAPPRGEPRDLTVTRERGEVLVLGADGTELWRVEVPDTYRIHRSSIAPDGGHAALVDSTDRLLVVPTDGSTPPRVWAEDVSSYPDLAWASERVADAGR
jgi:hypothetical protein